MVLSNATDPREQGHIKFFFSDTFYSKIFLNRIVVFIKFSFTFICSKVREIDAEKQTESEIFICCFRSQMFSVAGTWPGQTSEPGIHLSLPHVSGT